MPDSFRQMLCRAGLGKIWPDTRLHGALWWTRGWTSLNYTNTYESKQIMVCDICQLPPHPSPILYMMSDGNDRMILTAVSSEVTIRHVHPQVESVGPQITIHINNWILLIVWRKVMNSVLSYFPSSFLQISFYKFIHDNVIWFSIIRLYSRTETAGISVYTLFWVLTLQPRKAPLEMRLSLVSVVQVSRVHRFKSVSQEGWKQRESLSFALYVKRQTPGKVKFYSITVSGNKEYRYPSWFGPP
jgi:hypothetical protein